MSRTLRMRARCAKTNPNQGTVVWDPVKSIWYTGMLLIAAIGGAMCFSLSAVTMAGLLTAFTLCFGHSVGLHRLLIHRSFRCRRWLEYAMVTTGVLVGMGGPRRMLFMHDIRDWSQRSPACHSFYSHQNSPWKDWFWNLHCRLRLDHPPEFRVERRVADSWWYGLLDRSWMLVQIPLAVLLFAIGGWPWVVWGVAVRVALSLTGHWFVGYLAHNYGSKPRLVENAAVQGTNVPILGLITMGEAWHNNHHAFPDSAKLGLVAGQWDAGWWLLWTLRRIGLVWEVQLPTATASVRREPDLQTATHSR